MKEFQSILLENIEISLPGYSLRRIALNQHMPRVEKLTEHRHTYQQWLLYLRGKGRQQIQNREVAVARGTVLMIEKEVSHRFIKESEVRPVCLAIDFDTVDAPLPSFRGVMNSQALEEVERLLVAIHEEERRHAPRPLAIASLILRTVDLLEGALLQGDFELPLGPVVRQIEEAIDSLGLVGATPKGIAILCDCTLDHLNRRLKEESEKTVGGMLNSARLESSTFLLKSSSLSIGEIGAQVGMDDQNYFSRWFRKQTGKTPSQWRILRNNS